MSGTTTCSECPRKTKRLESRGRPRLCCSDKCARKRIQRTRKEERAWQRENRDRAAFLLSRAENSPALVETPADRAALDDFNRFAKRSAP